MYWSTWVHVPSPGFFFPCAIHIMTCVWRDNHDSSLFAHAIILPVTTPKSYAADDTRAGFSLMRSRISDFSTESTQGILSADMLLPSDRPRESSQTVASRFEAISRIDDRNNDDYRADLPCCTNEHNFAEREACMTRRKGRDSPHLVNQLALPCCPVPSLPQGQARRS